MAVQISKKRKFVSDGIFKAELNEFLTRELAEDGYSGVEVRVTPTRTEIIILATRTQNVLGEKGRRIRELTAVVQKRFGFPEGSVESEETSSNCYVRVFVSFLFALNRSDSHLNIICIQRVKDWCGHVVLTCLSRAGEMSHSASCPGT
ncbi:40S ribosomal protein S3-A [Larimichthys crocea]|uniref:Uncharacterized protein n=1 Tax=Larimichthys crocea TaxID=215358 RepID=A0ACD3QJF4_LARCR|nr:40S ribosomal protein S3-A [Larimichthys crocea]